MSSFWGPLHTNSLFSDSGPGIFPQNPEIKNGLCAWLNSHVVSYLLRAISPSFNHFGWGYVLSLPLPNSDFLASLNKTVELAKRTKASIINNKITERNFDTNQINHPTLEAEVLLLSIEGYLQFKISESLHLDAQDLNLVFSEVGQPAGFYPLIEGYDDLSCVTSQLPEFEEPVKYALSSHTKCLVPVENIKSIKATIKAFYGSGMNQNYEDETELEQLDNDELDQSTGAFKPIPSELLIERISHIVKFHPISVYWIIKEGIEIDNWRCFSQEKKYVEDNLSVLVLHLLGYLWPKQIEAPQSIITWADLDGIIPLTSGMKDLSLQERVRSRLPEQFPGGKIIALEHEIAEIMSESLDKWLCGSFFKHHISQFKKRPIAWQLTSQTASGKGGKGKSKKGLDKAPAFACLVYYHKLNASTLTTIKSQYVSPLRQSYETELRTLEAIVLLSPEQSSRRLQLEAWIDELKEFEDRLESCAREGFASPALAQVAAKEPLDHWVSRDGQAQLPANRAEFEAQEMRYDPDLNDGVRVNIAPLQKFGLLAADVLDAKDIEKAITDRAEWRADERSWCREGKLPQPGWWK